MKSVCEFKSYREYLKKSYRAIKANQKSLTLEKYARQLGLSASGLKMILSGKRNLTPARVSQIARELKFSKIEREYFEALVLKEQSKRSEDKLYYHKRTVVIKDNEKLQQIVLSDKEFLTDHLVIPVMVYLTDIAKSPSDLKAVDAEQLSEKFNIPIKRVEKILKFLFESNALRLDQKNKEVHYSFGKLTHSLNQKIYLKNWFLESIQRMESMYSDQKTFFNASTISLPKDVSVQFKSELNELIQKYMSMDTNRSEEVELIQACFQVFPLLKERK